jgi:hypothetical protein
MDYTRPLPWWRDRLDRGGVDIHLSSRYVIVTHQTELDDAMRQFSGRLRGAFALCGTLVIAACSSQHATYAPDGRRGFVISCDGLMNDYGNCLVKAGRACGNRGYDTLKGNSDDRQIFIACKLPQ